MNNREIIVEENTKKYGKFADAAALLTAYENLEKEFTKKSQKLKQLERLSQDGNSLFDDNELQSCDEKTLPCDNEETSPQETPSDNLMHEVPTKNAEDTTVDNPEQSNGKFNPQQILSDRDFVERHILQNGDITREVLQRYIDFLSKSELPRTINSMAGAISLTPPKKPKTIKEASRLAEKFFGK